MKTTKSQSHLSDVLQKRPFGPRSWGVIAPWGLTFSQSVHWFMISCGNQLCFVTPTSKTARRLPQSPTIQVKRLVLSGSLYGEESLFWDKPSSGSLFSGPFGVHQDTHAGFWPMLHLVRIVNPSLWRQEPEDPQTLFWGQCIEITQKIYYIKMFLWPFLVTLEKHPWTANQRLHESLSRGKWCSASTCQRRGNFGSARDCKAGTGVATAESWRYEERRKKWRIY